MKVALEKVIRFEGIEFTPEERGAFNTVLDCLANLSNQLIDAVGNDEIAADENVADYEEFSINGLSHWLELVFGNDFRLLSE